MNIFITIIQNVHTKESIKEYRTDIIHSYAEKFKNPQFSVVCAIIISGVQLEELCYATHRGNHTPGYDKNGKIIQVIYGMLRS